MIEVSINGREEVVRTPERLGELLAASDQDSTVEAWLSVPGGSRICLLRSGTNAFLMYLRHAEDSGFVSGRPAVASDTQVGYRLSNGQVDQYPELWCVSLRQCREALSHFFSHEGARPDMVAWHES